MVEEEEEGGAAVGLGVVWAAGLQRGAQLRFLGELGSEVAVLDEPGGLVPSQAAQPRLGARQRDQPFTRHRHALLLRLVPLFLAQQEGEGLPRERAHARAPLGRSVEGAVLGELPERVEVEAGLARALRLLEEEHCPRRLLAKVELLLWRLRPLELLGQLYPALERRDLLHLLAPAGLPRDRH